MIDFLRTLPQTDRWLGKGGMSVPGLELAFELLYIEIDINLLKSGYLLENSVSFRS